MASREGLLSRLQRESWSGVGREDDVVLGRIEYCKNDGGTFVDRYPD